MNGFCDVPGCTDETYMGWRPLTERMGKQICQGHWNRHEDKTDDFSLFDVFGFKRPEQRITRPVQKEPSLYILNQVLASEPQPATPHRPEETTAGSFDPFDPSIKNRDSGCRACGGEREPGFTYCSACGRERKRRSNQARQRRHRQRIRA